MILHKNTMCLGYRLVLVTIALVKITAGCGDIGTVNPGSHTATTGGQTDQAFFVESGSSPCCGTLKNWKFYASGAGTIDVMLWRPTTGSNYELVSEESIAVTVGLSTPTPSSTLEIDILDVVGWKTTGAELIPSSATAGSTTQNQLLAAVSVGSEVPWAGTQDTANTYAFGAVVSPNIDPVVIGDTVVIDETVVSQSIHTIDVTDADTANILDPAFSVTMTGDSQFSLVQTVTGYDIETGSTLTAGTYPLVITATDRCAAAVSETVTVTVTDIVPVFSPDPLQTTHPVDISDATTAATSLYAFSVTDNGPVTCTSDNPLFEIKTVTPNFELWLKSVTATDLNFDTSSSQAITISCTDGTTAILSAYTVPLFDEPPVLANLGGITGPISDLVAVGTSVHQFTATDQDDVVSCSVDAPHSSKFTITAVDGVTGTQRFDIETSSTLNEDITPSYGLGITCTDGRTPVTDTQTVNLYDEIPTLTGLPFTATAIVDGVQTAAVLGSFSVSDVNDQAITTCTIQTPYDTLFSVASGAPPVFEVSTINGATLAIQTYNLNIQCQDDEAVNVVSGTFTVPVIDQPPVFVNPFPTGSSPLSDDTVAETSLAKFTVSEAVTCSITNPAGSIYEVRTVPSDPTQPEFEIWVQNPVTEPDIDYNDQAVPLTLTITCTDGTSDVTGDFDVNIVDASPVLTGLPGTTFDSVPDTTTTELFIDSFTVTDSDDAITCTIDAGDPSASVFEIRLNATTGLQDIFLSTGASLDATVTPSYDLPITCTDGINDVTGTKTVLISPTPPYLAFGTLPFTTDPISDALDTLQQFSVFRIRSLAGRAFTCTTEAAPPNENDFNVRHIFSGYHRFQILAANNLNYDVNPFIIVNITCTDSAGAAFESYYNVTLYDEDPVQTGLPGTYQTLVDTETAATLLHTFQMTDSDDTISCEVDPGTPEAAWFEVIAGTAPDFEIWYRGMPPASLDYVTTPFYNLSIICNDGAVYTITETYDVEIGDGPPVFVNLPASTPNIAEDVTTNTLLFSVTASDRYEVTCYLTDTVTAAGIVPLEHDSTSLPYTVYNVYGYHTTGFDFEATGGTLTVDVTCGDSSSTVTDTLTINIINAAPVILNPGGSSTISEAETGEVPLKTLDLQDFDATDATCTLTDNDGGPFSLTNNELKKTAGALDYETQTTYDLKITCTDGTLSTTDTYTVNVDNMPPEITNLPTAGSIAEEQVDEILLFDITLSEDATSCDQVAPVQSEFVVKYEPTTNLWSIYYVSEAVAGKPLNWAVTKSYDINVACTDAGGATGATKVYTINVVDNEAPTFTNIAGNPVTKVQVNAKAVNATDTAFTVLADDTEGNPITYTMVGCKPDVNATCPFTLSSDGNLVAVTDLHSDPESFYTVSVMIEDKYNPNATVKDLIVELVDRNTPPVFTNLPKLDVVGVDENNAVGDVLYDINHYDPDAVDTVKYFCTFTDGGNAYFSCDETTGEIKALSSINYEQMSRLEYRVEVYADDGYSATPVESLKLRIKDVNEEPAFQNTNWVISKPDEGGPGQEVGCPDFKGDILDEDLNDLHTYTMVCNSDNGIFVMDSKTGCVTMTEEWDLDLPSRRTATATFYCTVTATDQGGNTTEAQLQIEINESDDNIPYTRQTSYVVCAGEGTSSGGMGQVLVDDNDVLPEHREHTFDFIGSGPFFVDGNGVMSYGDVSNYAVGTSFDTTMRVTDDAGNTSDTPVTVMICDTATYQTYMSANSVSVSSGSGSASGSASSSSSSSSDLDWLYWLIPALLLLGLMAGLLAYLIRKCCLSGRCGKRWVKSSKIVQGPMKMRKVTMMRRRVVVGGHQGYRQGAYGVSGGQGAQGIQGMPGEQPALPPPENQTQPTNAPPRKSLTPPQNTPSSVPAAPKTPGTIAPLELPITHYYARDVGNLGGAR